MNGKDMAGNTITNFPLQAGLNNIRISELNAAGSADDIWGMYCDE
jgi:hypothetical protein